MPLQQANAVHFGCFSLLICSTAGTVVVVPSPAHRDRQTGKSPLRLWPLFVFAAVLFFASVNATSAANEPFIGCDAKKFECASLKRKVTYRNDGCYDGSGCGPGRFVFTTLGEAQRQSETDWVRHKGYWYCSHSVLWGELKEYPLNGNSATSLSQAAGSWTAPRFFSGGCSVTSSYQLSPGTLSASQITEYTCEPGWEAVGLTNGSLPSGAHCRKPKSRCDARYGNPCNVLTGAKLHTEVDARIGTTGLLDVARRYNSIPSAPMAAVGTDGEDRWRFRGRPYLDWFTGSPSGGQAPRYFARVVDSETAATFELDPATNVYKPIAATDGVLKRGPIEAGVQTWLYFPHAGDLLLWFKGASVTTWRPDGIWASQGGTSVDVFGRSWSLVSVPTGLEAVLSDGSKISYTYSQVNSSSSPPLRLNRLDSVRYQDGTTRSYLYEQPHLPANVTGVVDQMGRRIATWTYETGTGGRLARTYAHAADVQQYQYVYAATGAMNTAVTVINPLGAGYTLTIVDTAQGRQIGAKADNNCDDQCRAKGGIKATVFAADGTPQAQDDVNGNRICRVHETERLYETVRVEGLPSSQVCSDVAGAGSALPAGARKISTQWHPQWRLATKVAEPGRITTSVYNGQPDPFNGNTVASCAPPSALLPDGSRIAVLCRQVEQATTDANGSLGFAAPLQTGVAAREQRWTYNEFGQVLSHDGPRTDVTDTALYEYYSATSFTGTDPNAVGVTRGDLKKVTPPIGGYTLYKLYNKLGQVLETEDANGVITTYTYDLRQRLTSMTVAGQTTLYDYWPTGLIKRITQPDASWVSYDHDDAHRLVKVSDNLGHSITYTLDNLGNRVDEQVKDPGGTLRRNLARGIDALGRVQQVTGRE
jgi:YD repeat-containing protein